MVRGGEEGVDEGPPGGGGVSIEWRLKAAKVRLWERAKLKEAGRDTNHLVTERMKQVRDGGNKRVISGDETDFRGDGEGWSDQKGGERRSGNGEDKRTWSLGVHGKTAKKTSTK